MHDALEIIKQINLIFSMRFFINFKIFFYVGIIPIIKVIFYNLKMIKNNFKKYKI